MRVQISPDSDLEITAISAQISSASGNRFAAVDVYLQVCSRNSQDVKIIMLYPISTFSLVDVKFNSSVKTQFTKTNIAWSAIWRTLLRTHQQRYTDTPSSCHGSKKKKWGRMVFLMSHL